ncbi:helicase RepA family protein [Sansalvadorimonas sp. 2012CJ34-2]|uniref:Helicase RepA family protein n=1 Tax=Parendozoicomonas callyspongiae TaxID=2942213 RepID=A0ABT0PJC7_9GAMM|nr:AAA family ATPase [Sansalvadorimonas sp. 2012CJ34-2]MCL6271076.1 helicase RepA family protein [Sansalvadorimonas sp. 2012CJ34-2]
MAGEGHNGLARRFKAWEIANNTQLGTSPIYISAHSARLMETTQAIQICQSIEAQVGDGPKPVLLVIDTLARNFGPGDENNTQDMNRFIAHLDQHFRKLWSCCVHVVHHTGVSTQNRARGNSALKGALDAEYALKRTDDVLTLTTHKMKDTQEPAPQSFELITIQLPDINEDGEHESSCVLKPVAAKLETDSGKRIGKTQRGCLEELEQLYDQHQAKLSDAEYSPEGARVRIDDWRNACVGKDKPLKTRNNFTRIKEALVEHGQIQLQPPYVYLKTQDNEI